MVNASRRLSATVPRRLAIACLAAVLVAGCSSEPSPADSPPASFDGLIEAALDDARTSGADQSQIEALEVARAEGGVTAENYKAAQRRTLECMSESGATVTDIIETEQATLPVLDASVQAGAGMADDELLTLMDHCEVLYSAALKGVYFQQPSSLDEWFGRVEAHRSELLACLREHGATIPDDAPMDELFRVTEEVNLRTADEGRPINCMLEVGAIDM